MATNWGSSNLKKLVLLAIAAGSLAASAYPLGASATTGPSHSPGWIKAPDAETISDFYPTRANQMNVQGTSTIKCVVRSDHRLHDCVIASESPAGYGFGEAAIRASSTFQLRPAIENGVEQSEGEVTVPLRWAIDKSTNVWRPHLNLGVFIAAVLIILAAGVGLWMFGRQIEGAQTPFSGRMLAGEKVVWSGKPFGGLMFTPKDAILVPFHLIWLVFAVFWTGMMSLTPEPWFALFGLIFVCIGLFGLLGRFWLDAQVRRGISYAVTNKRVLISRPRPFGEFTALALDRLADARLSVGKNGRGTIRFGQTTSLSLRYYSVASWAPALDSTPQFIAVDGVERVFDLVQRTGAVAG